MVRVGCLGEGNRKPAAWQRGLAFSLGRLAGREAEPSAKQAKQGVLILDEALALGFRM